MARTKGQAKTGGRQAGTPNKATAAVKGFITDLLQQYMQPANGSSAPTIQEDLEAMQPAERVKAITALANYILPKQQAVTMEEQQRIEQDALTAWLETAPQEAINGIAAKIMEMQARNRVDA